MWWAELNERRRLLLLRDEQMPARQEHHSFAPRTLRVGPRLRNFAAPFHHKIDQGNRLQNLQGDELDTRRCLLKQQDASDAVGADSLDLWVMLGKLRTRELRNAARLPIDLAPLPVRQGKPRDLRYPVADRDQRHPHRFGSD